MSNRFLSVTTAELKSLCTLHDHMLHRRFYLQCSIHIKGKSDTLRSLYTVESVQNSSEIQGSCIDFLILTKTTSPPSRQVQRIR